MYRVNHCPRVGLVTYDQLPCLNPDDTLLPAQFRKVGINASPVIWSDWEPKKLSERFDALIFRSCWDYFKRVNEFRQWIEAVEETNLRIFNSLKVLNQNFDKNYLLKLQSLDVPVPATQIVKIKNRDTVPRAVAEMSVGECVVKPAISAWGMRAYKWSQLSEKITDSEDSTPWRMGEEWVIQEFLPEIHSEGEWSLIYFAGCFSHAARKVPGCLDFRVHLEYGGTWFSDEPSDSAVRVGMEALEALEWIGIPYVRVDGINHDHQFHVLEVEAFEPLLFFDGNTSYMDRFVHACVAELAMVRFL